MTLTQDDVRRPVSRDAVRRLALTAAEERLPPVTGDRLDFATYVAARRPALLRIAHAITGNQHDAEDLVQAALTKVLPAWSRIRNHSAADAYVRRTMFNHQASRSRERWRTAEYPVGEPPERPEPPELQGLAAGAGSVLPPDERAALWHLVRTLPPRQRAAVVLRFYEDMSEAETARALGCSVGTVKSSTSRGLANLRRRVRATAPEARRPASPPTAPVGSRS